MEKKELNNLIEKANKYHYVGCDTKKCNFIVSSNDKSYAKEKTIENLKTKWNEIIDSVIYRVTLKKSVKGDWNKKENKFLSGPIFMKITEYIIKPKNKLKETSSGINSQVFFTEKYLRENGKIKKTDVVNLILKFKLGELKKGRMETNFI